jgi:peptidoglycan/LPS O-acetylase OafA/YrhL
LGTRGERFRPDLEGLRAIAVLLVLLYHAGLPGFAGGYIGVDVFFVLSGFLITGIIARELSGTGRFDLPAFYARRVRRLIPAAAVTLVATLVISALVLPAIRIPGVSKDIASAGLYVSNLRFGLQANDYFQLTSTPSPVLHFWSLSVEEQFYLFWPAALLASTRLRLGSRRMSPGLAVLAIGIPSLVFGVWLTGVNQPWAFFLLPTRAWELAAGGLLAIHAQRLTRLPDRLAIAATPLGIVLIVAANVLVNDATPYPGLAAILPVTGSVLVIAGGMPTGSRLACRLLSLPPMRYLGRISYSLYLWHWPMIVLGSAVLGAAFVPALAFASIGVAALSQRFVEEPLRYGRFIGSVPRWNLAQAAVAGVVLLAVSLATAPVQATLASVVATGREADAQSATAQPAGAPSATAQPVGAEPSPSVGPTVDPTGPMPCVDCTVADLTPTLETRDQGFFANCGTEEITNPANCVLGDKDSARVIAVFGDSYAWMWVPAIERYATSAGVRVLNLVRGACPATDVTVWSDALKRVDTECNEWRTGAIARIAAERPSLVILASSNRETLIADDGSAIEVDGTADGPHFQRWVAGLERTIGQLTTLGADVAVIGQPPRFTLAGVDPIDCLSTHPTDFQAACSAPRSQVLDLRARAEDAAATAATGAVYIDPVPWLCGTRSCTPVIGRTLVYRDLTGHLTAPFARSQMQPLIAALGLAR